MFSSSQKSAEKQRSGSKPTAQQSLKRGEPRKMNRPKLDALLSELADQLNRRGSWCGETHIQKAAFFLQKLRKVPLGFDFILYKHGPFSFDLRDELTAMRADGFLDLLAQWPYGPSLVPTRRSVELRQDYPKTLSKYGSDVEFVSDALGDQNVAELEKLATALYVYFERESDSQRIRAKILHDLKPHISFSDSFEAVRQVDSLIERSA
jgi:uncharacterized protein YwgA